jgi:hypothetical protein
MTIRERASRKEIESIDNFIVAKKKIQNLTMQLRQADKAMEEAARAVSVEMFREEGGEPVCVLPETFVTQHDGEWFLITLDVEGEDAHEIKLIGGLL